MAFNRPLEACFQYVTGIQDLEDPVQDKDNNGSEFNRLSVVGGQKCPTSAVTRDISVPDLLQWEHTVSSGMLHRAE